MLLSLCQNLTVRFNLKQIVLPYLALEETFKLLTLIKPWEHDFLSLPLAKLRVWAESALKIALVENLSWRPPNQRD